jgi:hypothetical protein
VKKRNPCSQKRCALKQCNGVLQPAVGYERVPDYQQWREEQIRGLDEDYKAWRDERYSNFSNEFGEWRKNRKDQPSAGASASTGRNDQDADRSTGKSK